MRKTRKSRLFSSFEVEKRQNFREATSRSERRMIMNNFSVFEQKSFGIFYQKRSWFNMAGIVITINHIDHRSIKHMILKVNHSELRLR